MNAKRVRSDALYLDTINRTVLDFDFEKVCSVCLQNTNVYCCLVCGKYYQGRGKTSPAYFHSLNDDHHVFMNLETLNVYVLPDGYQVHEPSLEDIQYVACPKFVKPLKLPSSKCKDLFGKEYIPGPLDLIIGYVGLNNIKSNDYCNVIVHALNQVVPLRDYLLVENPTLEFAKRFAMLLRKIWNNRAFKAHVSPHELMQEISTASKKKYRLGIQSDPIEFLPWFLNNLHIGLGGSKKPGSSIIHKVFQGQIEVDVLDSLDSMQCKTLKTPFLYLSLDLPKTPLFADEEEERIIPQVTITSLLEKYNNTPIQDGDKFKRYRITVAPSYLILTFKRFSTNEFKEHEKNPTIVNFPLKDLEIAQSKYDLVASICHKGTKLDGVYKIHVHNNDGWYEIQDLFVEKIAGQMVILSETHVQIWARKSS